MHPYALIKTKTIGKLKNIKEGNKDKRVEAKIKIEQFISTAIIARSNVNPE